MPKPTVSTNTRARTKMSPRGMYGTWTRGARSEPPAAEPAGSRGDEPRGGNRQDPRGDDISRDSPAHRRQALRRADADDRARDGMRRRYRNAERVRDVKRQGTAGLRREAADRLQR